MKICENGIIREMTAEEIAELEAMAGEVPEAEPTAEERLASAEVKIQEALEDIKAAKEQNQIVEMIESIL